ncbi:MAG: hypothetical protein MJ175_03135 [Clostridia bacterium]|nr:hypothetical protein [Clostridia bacterium]
MKMKKSKKIALSAILSALSVLILFAGAVIDVLSMTAAAFASLFIIIIMIEVGMPYPVLVWGVTSALSLILLPNKLPAIMYFLICGIYPILKAQFERLHYVVSWVLKLSVFNISLLLMITISKYIFYLNDSSFDFTIPVIVIGNLALILYDIAMSKIILLYIVKMRKHLGLKNYFEY